MEKNKKNCFKRLSFTVILLMLGMVSLFSQDDRQESGGNDSMSAQKLHGEILDIRNEIVSLKNTARETGDLYNSFIEKISKPQVWQIISAVSAAIIAVSILCAAVLFVLNKNKQNIPLIKQKTGIDVKENSAASDVKNAALEELPAEIKAQKIKFDEIQTKLNFMAGKIDSLLKESAVYKNNFTSIQTESAESKQKISKLETAVSLIKTEIINDKEKHAMKEEIESDPVSAFNKWSQNSLQPLPKYFTYVTILKPDLRTKQESTDTGAETDWIRNTVGEKKYLFPNPNKIDNLYGQVDKLYKVVGTRKSAGNNTVKIIDACQVKEGNYIEYQGELKLL